MTLFFMWKPTSRQIVYQPTSTQTVLQVWGLTQVCICIMKSFVYYKLPRSFHQGPLHKHKVVKTVETMVWNLELKCKCGSTLISGPPQTNITLAKQVVCALLFLCSDRKEAEEQSQNKMQMMTLDFLLWTRLRRDTEESVWEGVWDSGAR